MKLPEPKQLPSGKWHVQVMVQGRRMGKTFRTKEEASYWAAGVKTKCREAEKSPRDMTVGELLDRYIMSKDSVLSPSTIAGYKQIRKGWSDRFVRLPLADLTQEKVQREINAMAKTKSPKSVRNAHGLLSAALAEFWPDKVLHTTLPQKQRYEAAIPSPEDIVRLAGAAEGLPIELPLLLAAWMGLRLSEICGLTWDCIEGDTLHIKQAMVYGEDGPVLKGTKTYSGDRRIRIPPRILALIRQQPRRDAYIIHMSGRAIYKAFVRLCKASGVQHYRFHDLRHMQASVMLALGIPDKYAMERMGHASPNMLKMVYQHTMQETREQVADMVDDYFSALLSKEQ